MGLWFYHAPGSGIYYHTGRSITVSDMADVHCLNLHDLDTTGGASFCNVTAGLEQATMWGDETNMARSHTQTIP